jgi:hypothetical protein
MFLASKWSFDVDILVFLAFQLFWLLCEKLGNFFLSSGHTDKEGNTVVKHSTHNPKIKIQPLAPREQASDLTFFQVKFTFLPFTVAPARLKQST